MKLRVHTRFEYYFLLNGVKTVDCPTTGRVVGGRARIPGARVEWPAQVWCKSHDDATPGAMNLDDLISRCTAAPDERWDICAELYNALDTGGAEPIDLAPYAPSFAAFWRDVDEHVRPFQRNSGHSWRWQDEYQDPRNEAALLLDILGYVPGKEVTDELQSALTLTDCRLVMFAAVSLLRQRNVLPPEVIEHIAACDETRGAFRQLLNEIGFSFLFPPAYQDRESAARSAMVDWLTSPEGWECAPDRLHLLEIVDDDIFVYAFSTAGGHWSSNQEPMAGIAGRETFSDFRPAGSATPQEHAWRMLGLANRD
jgi:hypothetical protein